MQDRERLLNAIKEEHIPGKASQNQDIPKENGNLSKTESTMPTTLGKSLSFDSGINERAYSKDDADKTALKRARTMPSNSGRTTLPRESKVTGW